MLNLFISYRRVGGLRFLKIGRLTMSWSVAAKAKAPRKSRKEISAAKFERGFSHGYERGMRYGRNAA